MSKKLLMAASALALVALSGTLMISHPAPVVASDHDDGETDTKSRNTNLTDMYVFREGDQDGIPADNANLIIALNLNPRSLPRQQYFFNQTARYVLHIGHTSSSLNAPTGNSDVDLRFTFGAPNANGQQAISVQRVNLANNVPDEANAVTVSAGNTQLDKPGIRNADPTASGINNFTLDGNQFTVFAGLREDPFFFDVTQFFRVRAGLAGLGPAVGFRNDATAVDFTKDYNVLSIVLRAPVAALQRGTTDTTFDVFATIDQPQ